MKVKKLSSLVLGAALLLTLLAGCGGTTASTSASPSPSASNQTSPAAEQVTLNISAAASLTDVMNQIAEAYKTVAPNVKLTFTFDSSGTLQTQIEQGAPADVFFSAATKQMTALKEKNLVETDTIKNILTNKVVLIVPADSKSGLTSFQDVATSKVK
ncbi:MAG: molybdate ABC transporter substrate-binding protein, partial [Oscillospiraceae bacterium]|nr:molybdate ABC transporter substrate-binding protein [Oscillospiraceae bacterium]